MASKCPKCGAEQDTDAHPFWGVTYKCGSRTSEDGTAFRYDLLDKDCHENQLAALSEENERLRKQLLEMAEATAIALIAFPPTIEDIVDNATLEEGDFHDVQEIRDWNELTLKAYLLAELVVGNFKPQSEPPHE